MKIKTSELTGTALDWAVAKAQGFRVRKNPFTGTVFDKHLNFYWVDEVDGAEVLRDVGWIKPGYLSDYRPSTDWAQGGPVKEREGIATRRSNGKWYAMLSDDLGDGERAQWSKFTFRNVPRSASTSRQCRFEGATELQAAMRCFVASKLGDEVDVPGELT